MSIAHVAGWNLEWCRHGHTHYKRTQPLMRMRLGAPAIQIWRSVSSGSSVLPWPGSIG